MCIRDSHIAVVDIAQGLLHNEFRIQTVGKTEIPIRGDQVLMVVNPVTGAKLPTMSGKIRIRRNRRGLSRSQFGLGQFLASRPTFLASRGTNLVPIGAAE